jgi:hypothetical protein
VVSVEEKAQQKLCQVEFGETSESKPSKRCRKLIDDVKTGGLHYSRKLPEPIDGLPG